MRLELLVLAADRHGCAGVDMSSGALLRADYPEPVSTTLRPLVIVTADVVRRAGPADDAQPDVVELAHAPQPIGQMRPRRAERWLRPLLHPTNQPLLGFSGEAVPYWMLRGDRPSLALVAPSSAPLVRRAPGGARCRFRWRGIEHDLPLTATALPRTPPRRLVLSLTGPHDGYCYKVVSGLLAG